MDEVRTALKHYEQEGRIQKTLDISQVLASVVKSENERRALMDQMKVWIEKGANIELGGRRLREMLGYTVEDISPNLILIINWDLDVFKQMRLGTMMKILDKYPVSRKSKPDVDFFVKGIKPVEIVTQCQTQKIAAKLHKATGGVEIAEISYGEAGFVSLVDHESSWQTKELWPPIAARAPLMVEKAILLAKTDLGMRFQDFPLELPGIENMETDNPERALAVCRDILYMVSIKTPQNNFLKMPPLRTRQAILETVNAMANITMKATRTQEIPVDYRSSLRDMGVALTLILKNRLYNDVNRPFCHEIVSTWTNAMINTLGAKE